MSVQFGNVSMSNEAASQVLRAIGYQVTESNDGAMAIDAMLAGIERALVETRRRIEEKEAEHIGEDLDLIDFLEMVEDEVLTAKANGEVVFRWS